MINIPAAIRIDRRTTFIICLFLASDSFETLEKSNPAITTPKNPKGILIMSYSDDINKAVIKRILVPTIEIKNWYF